MRLFVTQGIAADAIEVLCAVGATEEAGDADRSGDAAR